jgi:hypothetical protein
MTKKAPPVPEGTGPSGTLLWRDLTRRFLLTDSELVLLKVATRVVDRLDVLDETIRAGGPEADRALREARQQQITAARLIGALRLPPEEPSGRPMIEHHRSQHRGGAYGVYPLTAP